MFTLNEMSQLREFGFGQPEPKHGLRLLYWFAHDYIEMVNGNVVPKINPKKGAFGFHKFQNRIEDDEHIVPLQNLPYYEVGNLNAPDADRLPHYVRELRSGFPHSNTDRIIVRLDNSTGYLNRVYVTEHSDLKRFDKRKTYRVSQGLLQNIRNMNLEQYLNHSKAPSETQPESNSWCAIL